MSYDPSGSARRFARWARSDVIDRKEYAELDVDTKVELIRSLVLLHVEGLLDEEVTARFVGASGAVAARLFVTVSLGKATASFPATSWIGLVAGTV